MLPWALHTQKCSEETTQLLVAQQAERILRVISVVAWKTVRPRET